MNCTCKVEQRRLMPAVFNLKQHLNGAETMVWELDNCVINQGTCDLKKYDATLVLCVDGVVDEILLVKEHDAESETMKLKWNVGIYATALSGHVKYQIVFRSAQIGTLGVIGAEDVNANGTYNILNESAEGTARVYTNATGYRIDWDNENNRWQMKDDKGGIIDYQATPSIKPYCGAWGKVAVSNAVSAVWASDEAIMYISETIAADQYISANFPTILRQVWEKVRSMILKAGASTATVPVTETDWKGAESPYYIDLAEIGGGNAIPYGAEIMQAIIFKGTASAGYSDIATVKIEQKPNGKTYVYSPEKVTGKAVILIKGGMTYSEAGTGGDIDTSNLAGDNLPIQLGSPVSIKGYVDAQIGDVNAILDNINGVEV